MCFTTRAAPVGWWGAVRISAQRFASTYSRSLRNAEQFVNEHARLAACGIAIAKMQSPPVMPAGRVLAAPLRATLNSRR
jgi:hypothetical protein